MTSSQYAPEQGPGALSRSLRQLARTWWLTIPLTLLLAFAGGFLAFQVPTTYTAEARLSVGGQSLSAQSVPGFALASQQLAGTYARYVDDAQALDYLDELLPDQAAEVSDVSASPIAESSVIIIEVRSQDQDTAVQAANAISDDLIAQVSAGPEQVDPEAALLEFQDLSKRVADGSVARDAAQNTLDRLVGQQSVAPAPATFDAEIAALRAQIAQLSADNSVLELQQEAAGEAYRNQLDADVASLQVIREAQISGNDLASRAQIWTVIGAVLGLFAAWLIGSAVSSSRERSRQRKDRWSGLEQES